MAPLDNLPICRALLPLRLVKRGAGHLVAVVVRLALSRERRHQCGIATQRHPVERREVLRHDLQCPLVARANARNARVAQELAVDDSGPRLSENLRPRALQRPRAALQ